MIPLPFVQGRRIAVMGLGKTGLSALVSLRASGADILAWDDTQAGRDEAQEAGYILTDLTTADFSDVDFLLLSPGIPHTFPSPHPVAARAREAGIPIVCDIDLLCRALPDADIIGITGTNGKSTTTALTGHILRRFRPAVVGGNIGEAVLTLDPIGPNGTYVLELSSYQLERAPSLRLKGGILLNLSPDHIDRHGDMNGYAIAKESMFKKSAPPAIAVICVDTEPARDISERLYSKDEWKVIPVSTEKILEDGVYVRDGKLYDSIIGSDEVLDFSLMPTLKGRHNHENAACAYALIRYMYGYAPEAIGKAMQDFPGLPHRQYPVRKIGNVNYINDSKATNADAVARALASYDHIYLILGGLPKQGGLSGLEVWKDRIAHAFLIGKASDEFAMWLTKNGVPFTRCEVLARAVEAAHNMAQADPGPDTTILLSPACASWDQFRSFEHRGDEFSALVNALPGSVL